MLVNEYKMVAFNIRTTYTKGTDQTINMQSTLSVKKLPNWSCKLYKMSKKNSNLTEYVPIASINIVYYEP